MSGEFSPGGKGHKVLTRLDQGPADMTALAALIRGPNQTPNAARQRAYNMLSALRSQGLIRSSSGLHVITIEGRAALQGLDHGFAYRVTQPLPRPNPYERQTA